VAAGVAGKGRGRLTGLEDFEPALAAMFPLPISWLEPRDIPGPNVC
jgi:hypothetical protein